MSYDASIRTLIFASWSLIAFGLLFFLTVFTPVSAITLFLVDAVRWPLDGAQSLDAPETKLMLAISAGLITGWGVMLLMLTRDVYATDPEKGGRLILAGIASWFIIDSAGSILSGFSLNAVANLGFLGLFVLPVLLRKKDAQAKV